MTNRDYTNIPTDALKTFYEIVRDMGVQAIKSHQEIPDEVLEEGARIAAELARRNIKLN